MTNTPALTHRIQLLGITGALFSVALGASGAAALAAMSGCAAQVAEDGYADDEVILDAENKADSNAPRLPELGVVYRTYLRTEVATSGISRLRIDAPIANGVATYRAIYREGGGVDIPARVIFVNRRSTRTVLMRIYSEAATPVLVKEYTVSFDRDGYLVLGNGQESLARLEPIDNFAGIEDCIPLLQSTEEATVVPGSPGNVVATSGALDRGVRQVVYMRSETLSTQLVYPCSVTVADDPETSSDDATLTSNGTCALLEGGTPVARRYAFVYWKQNETTPSVNVPYTVACYGVTSTVNLGSSSFTYSEPVDAVYDEPDDAEEVMSYWVNGKWCPTELGC